MTDESELQVVRFHVEQATPRHSAQVGSVTESENLKTDAKESGSDTRFLRYAAALRQAAPDLPDLTISYTNLGYELQVPVESRDVPNWASVAVQTCIPRSSSKPAQTFLFKALTGATGIIRPGDLTLVIAPPGHGKTTLLKALSGRFQGEELKHLRGEVRWDGLTYADLQQKGRAHISKLCAFVDQGETHYPMLTVRETLTFAMHQSNADLSSLASGSTLSSDLIKLHEDKVNIILEMLGLRECADTPVGGTMLRGISGGQKRRLTLGEMLITQARSFFLDEITNGLDASAALDIIRTLRRLCKANSVSATIALLQPAPEIVDLFDRIILMREGYIIFSGSKDQLQQHFVETLRIEPSPRVDLADWLVEFLTDPINVWKRDRRLQMREAVRAAKVAAVLPVDNALVSSPLKGTSEILGEKRLGGARTLDPSNFPLTTSKLVTAFTKSDLFAEAMRGAQASLQSQSESRKVLLDASGTSEITRRQYFAHSSNGAWRHVKLNLWRQVLFYTRSPQFVGPRIGSATIMGLVIGSVYYQLGTGPHSFIPRLGVSLSSLTFLSFANGAELPLAAAFKMAVAKQVKAGFYRPYEYLLSVIFSHFPLAIVESVVFTLFLYFMSGFFEDAGRYFSFMVVALLQNLLMSGFYRYVAYVMDDANVALSVTAPTTAFCMLFAGFLIVREKIPDYAIWLYWLSPFSWGLRTDVLREFHSPSYDRAIGDAYLDAFTIQKDDTWEWAGPVYMTGLAVFTAGLSVIGLQSAMGRWLTRGTKRIAVEEEPPTVGEVRVNLPSVASNASSADSSFAGSNAATEALSFERMDLSWSDIKYTVQVPKETEDGKMHGTKDRVLLNGVSGFARAGQLTALMGSSGAGKTTLMDVLASRKTSGKVEGAILVNGHSVSRVTFARLNGYCEQGDVHLGTETVRDAVEFSAKLRLPANVSPEVRQRFVEQILDDLELLELQHHAIGDETLPGLSPGELKRLTIAVELAANPSILFLDEPTTALDSRAALNVVRVIRKIAQRGRAVVCTIHQPSAELLSYFDRMLLLQTGGSQVYFGPLGDESTELVDYFSHAEIPANTFRPQIGPSQNPAAWMLEVIGAGTRLDKSALPDWSSIYAQSDLYQENQEILGQLQLPRGHTPSFDTPHARSGAVQWIEILKRMLRMYYRSVQFNYVRVLSITFLSLVMGLLYRDINDSDEFGVIGKMAAAFTSAGFLTFTIGSQTMPIVLKLRECFYKEQASQTYAAIWHANALAVVELPYLAVFTLVLFTIPLYFLIGYENSAGAFFHFFAVMFLCALYACYLGQFLASFAPNLQVANIIFPLFLTLHFTFGGVFVPKSSLPIGWHFMYYLSPLSKVLAAISIKQYECEAADCPRLVSLQYGGQEMSRWEFVQRYLASGKGWDAYYVWYLLLMVVAMRLFATAAILKVSHYTR